MPASPHVLRPALGALSAAAVLAFTGGAGEGAGPFPLHVKMMYLKSTGAVTVQGQALPGTVVQVRNASTVVKAPGTYSLRTSLPIALTAVRQSKIRRFRFELPAKAKPHISKLIVSADLSRMWARIDGYLTSTEHPQATVTVTHVQAKKTVNAALAKGNFVVGLPMVSGTNTLRWTLHIGPLSWSGPDINFVAQ